MKITCESCSAKYTIADDKVRGRKVKIRCKGCGTPIVVDGQQSSAPSNGEAASSEAEAAVSVEAPASMMPEAEWSVNLSDTEQLSLSTAQIVEGWQSGRITADAFVWKDGMGDWVPILESELASQLQAAPPAAAPPAAAAPLDPAAPAASVSPQSSGAARESKRPAARAIKPTGAAARTSATAARVTGGRAQGAQDLFAGVERAGSDEEEVQTSAPVLPQAGGRAQEEKATGARNENSVLFSLDALKAGFSGPSKAESTKPAPAAVSDDPFGMGSAPAVAGLGGGNSLFSLAENQALLTAPPPPEPVRAAPAVMAAGGHVSAAPPPSKNKLILFGVVGVAILGVGLALGIGLSGGKDDKDKATAETAAASEDKTGDKAKTEEPAKEEAKKEEEPKPAAEAKKEEEPAKDPTAQEPEKTEAKTEETAKTPATTPAGSPGTSSGSGSKPVAKEPKDDPKPAAVDAQPFSKNAAVAALSAAASSAASCKKIGGPTGTGKVTVTFAPSGRVTSANVNGAPFAGTSVGGCVASVFRRSKVPAFSGTQVTVSKSFTIR